MGGDEPTACQHIVSNTPLIAAAGFDIGAVNPDIAGSISTTTLNKYKQVIRDFHNFPLGKHLSITHLNEFDGLVMTYKATLAQVHEARKETPFCQEPVIQSRTKAT